MVKSDIALIFCKFFIFVGGSQPVYLGTKELSENRPRLQENSIRNVFQHLLQNCKLEDVYKRRRQLREE